METRQEDTYCIIDPQVKKDLEDKAKSTAKVTLQFNDYLIRGFTNCKSSDSAIITGVK